MSNLMGIFSSATWIEMGSIWFKIITRDIMFQQIPMRTFPDFTLCMIHFRVIKPLIDYMSSTHLILAAEGDFTLTQPT